MKHTIRILLSLLLAMSGAASACDYQQDFDESGAALQVLQPTFTLGSGDSAPESKALMATVLGELKNTSKSCIENIIVEVKFFDAQNKLVDANTEPVPGVEVLPGQEVAFRTVVFATRPKEFYSSMTARVVAAEQRITKKPRPVEPERSWLAELFVSWCPMLLLIGVWVFFIFRMNNSKKSPQAKSQALVADQNAILREQLKALEKIAASLEAGRSE